MTLSYSYKIGVDVDDVCAQLVREWVARYNADYNDNLQLDAITQWGIMHKLVKPECGEKIYSYIEDPAIYDAVLPVDGAAETIAELHDAGHRIIYVTTAAPGTAGVKRRWLTKHGFYLNPYDYIEAGDKSLIALNFLLDDSPVNIEKYTLGWGVMFDRPWNARVFSHYRVSSWAQFAQFIKGDD